MLWMMDFIRTSQDQHSALLHTLTTKESRPERPKTRTPDTYDGSDPKKLDPYISQCAAYIGSRWESFQGETDKVVWMHSYLKGSAHQHFAEQLSNASMAGLPPPAWYGSVQLFIDELTAVFGSPDPIADAIAAIESLSMRHGDKVHQYNLDFNRHAAKTLWDQNTHPQPHTEPVDIARTGAAAARRAIWRRGARARSDMACVRAGVCGGEQWWSGCRLGFSVRR